jgi:hypothetical protein
MWSKGVSWIDNARIPFVDDVDLEKKLPIQEGGTIYGGGKGYYRTIESKEYNNQGRFPANLLISDDMLNDGIYHKTGIASIPKGKKVYGRNSLLESKTEDYGGKFGALNEKGGSNSRYYDIDKWFDKLLEDIE